ncbi:hypothetical protein BTO30_12985 [Domibacillus antri]|uniref:Lipoprotein n=1 Tax=Domibacillus antri TaxID=1714264 RepID=A0A1Q8Q369_9BACI|nr:hypothetical protein [Domibacillus antri]OLN21768.1 hypothetical protein BTO30_12985 [Domibacillus antri]
MKKFYYMTAAMTLTVLMAAGCGVDESEQPVRDNQTDPTEEEWRDMPNALDNVLGTLQELKANAETPDEGEKIQSTGKQLEEHWDVIESQIEEQYPDDYENIEKSLYPLINETKKAQPDREKIKSLIDDTTAKLTDFLEKAETPKRKENGI